MLNSLQELLENAQMPASNEVDQSDVVCMTAGRRRRAHAGAGKVGLRTMKALVVLLLLRYGPPPPVAEALKLSAIKDDRGHVGLGLLRAVEVVRGRYERAWALVSSPEPSADDLDAALDLLQTNSKQWESLEPAVRLWTERESSETTPEEEGGVAGKRQSSESNSNRKSSRKLDPKSDTAATAGATASTVSEDTTDTAPRDTSAQDTPTISETTSRIYEEAASLLAHNRAVLGQALARSGHTDRGIEHLEAACPEIMRYQQNAQGRRDSKSWLHCYANLAEMYKTQERFEEASNLLTRMPWLPTPQQQGTPTTTVTALNSTGDDSTLSPDGVDTSPSSTHEPAALPSQNSSTEAKMPPGSGGTSNGSSVWKPAGGDEADLIGGDGGATCDLDVKSGDKAAESAQNAGDTARDGSATEATTTGENKSSAELSGKTASFPGGSNGGGGGGGGSRSDTSSVRGAGAARVAGLNKAAIAASAAASAESAGVTAQAVETRVEAEVRRAVERHAEAMRASMNELAGELAVTTATRPAASQEWLDSRVAAAEEVLAAVRAGLLSGGSGSDANHAAAGDNSAHSAVDVPVLPIGVPGHADILREASHYLSAIKGVAAQGWSYVDNELHRMERHPAPTAKSGFQSRREVIHTFRYLLMKARQYASENQTQTSSAASSSQPGARSRRKDRGRKASGNTKATRRSSGTTRNGKYYSSRGGGGGGADGDSAPEETNGFFMIFVGGTFALLAAALSSGARSGGPGRRREVVRQRAATLAAKSVGSYVEPPPRSAVASILAHTWGNLKRSGLCISSRAVSHAHLAKKFCAAAYIDALHRLRNARYVKFGIVRSFTANICQTAAPRKGANVAAPHIHKQRSRKHGKKISTSAVAMNGPMAQKSQAETETPPVSPCHAEPRSLAKSVAPADGEISSKREVDPSAPAAALQVLDTPVVGVKAADTLSSSEATAASDDGTCSRSDLPRLTGAATATEAVGDGTEATAVATTKMVAGETTAPDIAVEKQPVDVVAAPDAAPANEPAIASTAEITAAGVPFPDVLTAEQVKAMVEEDERAWAQARQSERDLNEQQQQTNFADRNGRVGERTSHEPEGDGWSEVGVGGSRSKGNNSAGGRGGRVLSMRNVRAVAARAARSSSPGSDPATTTSASSSECSDASKENVSRVVDTRITSRRVGGSRAHHHGAVGKDATTSNHTQHSGWTIQQSSNRGKRGAHATHGTSAAGARIPRPSNRMRDTGTPSTKSYSKDSDRHGSSSRPSRPSYAPWTNSLNASGGSSSSSNHTGSRPVRNTRDSRAHPRPTLTRQSVSAPSVYRGSGRAPWTIPAAGGEASKTSTRSNPQPPARVVTPAAPADPVVPVAASGHTVPKTKAAEDKPSEPSAAAAGDETPSPAPAPVAWTNTAAHPLGVQPEPAPVTRISSPSPAMDMAFPSPQHWEAPNHRQEQQQHVFHNVESPLMPTTAVGPAQHGHYQPPPPPFPPHQQHLAPPSREMGMPHFLPISSTAGDESYPPPSAHGNGPPPSGRLMYRSHSISIPPTSVAVAPGSGVDGGEQYGFHHNSGSFESQSPVSSERGDGGAGFSVLEAPPQLVMLPAAPHEQVQGGRFSPSHPVMPASTEDIAASGVMPPMYVQPSHGQSQQQQPLPPNGVYLPPGGGGMGGEVAGDGGALEALMGALCWQVEYYFSVENLVRDIYLRNLMDAEGYVAVSKIIVFNRVRSMTRDMSLLVAAMRRSTELELRDEEHSDEVYVRTRHSPLHWVSPQVQAFNNGTQQQPPMAHAHDKQQYMYEERHYLPAGAGEYPAHEEAEYCDGGAGDFGDEVGEVNNPEAGNYVEGQYPQQHPEYRESASDEPQCCPCGGEQQHQYSQE